ncbi:MAG TPA: beta-ketoacyl-ACP synthase, partial [Gammaproteobacteria bacterium]|nr:beta-ketoacyl-ACP synthase [Gammaproteobacteria bacterium]
GLIDTFDASEYPVRIAACVKNFDPGTVMDRKEVRRIDTFIQYGLAAGVEAIRDAGLP